MKDLNNNTNDKHIRDLLKWRLLEQTDDADLLTQKLIDMEAKLAFGTEALLVPSLQKEKELLQKLSKIKSNNKLPKWILPILLIVFIIGAYLIYNQSSIQQNVSANIVKPTPEQNNNVPAVITNDSTKASETITVVEQQKKIIIKEENAKSTVDEKIVVAIPETKANYMPTQLTKEAVITHASGNIPVFTEKQIAVNNKQKDKMVNALYKLDKSEWAFIPMGSGVYYGDTISMNAFCMSTKEVTNKEYMVFLNDLVINNKIDDYLKAVPDTLQWLSLGKGLEAFANLYLWHPAFLDYPVVNVSRKGAEMYCLWLTIAVNEKNKKTKEKNPNRQYMNDLRLPTEEEWMFAARGGKLEVEYPWGTDKVQNEKGCFLCNFSENKSMKRLDTISECSRKSTKFHKSGDFVTDGGWWNVPTDSYTANPYGLYCISGNVAEMVWQIKTKTPITKGGSWNSDVEHVKINSRENEGIIDAKPYIGFRPIFTFSK
jgi:formylglycine-generating enzyme required for sulfatase activity